MEHADDAAFLVLGQCHQFLHDVCRLYGIIDVGHQVLDAVDDTDIRFDGLDGHVYHPSACLKTQSTQVEGKELRIVQLPDLSQGHDPFFQDLLRALLTLFRIYPQHFQRFFCQSFHGQHLFFESTGHQDREEKCLSALRPAAVGC